MQDLCRMPLLPGQLNALIQPCNFTESVHTLTHTYGHKRVRSKIHKACPGAELCTYSKARISGAGNEKVRVKCGFI